MTPAQIALLRILAAQAVRAHLTAKPAETRQNPPSHPNQAIPLRAASR